MKTNDYPFTMIPTNLFILLDRNCRSMLFTMIQVSTYYAKEDGWFFRTYEDLEAESDLSQNLVKATIQTLFNEGIIDARPVGQSRGRKANYYKVNFDSFNKYSDIPIEECIKNPDLKIHTVPYKGSCFKLNLVRDTVIETVKETVIETVKDTVKSDNNINNKDNVYNKDDVSNLDIINDIVHKDVLLSNNIKDDLKDDINMGKRFGYVNEKESYFNEGLYQELEKDLRNEVESKPYDKENKKTLNETIDKVLEKIKKIKFIKKENTGLFNEFKESTFNLLLKYGVTSNLKEPLDKFFEKLVDTSTDEKDTVQEAESSLDIAC